MDKQEKLYITRDEDDDKIYVWRKPLKGEWSPKPLKDCGMVNYQRTSIENVDYYLASDFKKKFGITIRQKTKKSIKLPVILLDNEDYKLISSDPNRKQ